MRRRERVIRIFPNEESALRLIGAVLMEIDEAWSTGHRYFDMEEYWRLRAGPTAQDAVGMSNAEKPHHPACKTCTLMWPA